MSLNAKVVWADGMFLSPDHFLRNDRYIESLVEGRTADLRPYAWGFAHLVIDTQELERGTVAIRECRGVFPDGTPFDIGENDEPPAPLRLPEDVKDAKVVLALPKYRAGTEEVGLADSAGSLSRYVLGNGDADAAVDVLADDDEVHVDTARPRLRLMLESEETVAYASLGVVQISEVRPDKRIVLSERYIPPCLDIRAGRRLEGFVKEVVGHLHQKGEALAVRMADPSGGAAEIADFLFLMIINRYESWFVHLGDGRGMHPERCYQAMVHLAGELATITRDDKRPVPAPPYLQDDLSATFEPLMAELRRSIQWVAESRAIPIPVEKFKYGMWAAQINDRTLINNSDFVLVVSAEMPGNRLISDFPNRTTVGPESIILQLVRNNLTGIGIQHLTAAPRQLPFYKGSVYFSIDHNSKHWKGLEESGGLAFQVAGDFPGLQMELWAIRG